MQISNMIPGICSNICFEKGDMNLELMSFIHSIVCHMTDP